MTTDRTIISVEGVSFGYQPERLVFDGFETHIDRGEGLIVYGPVGSGKTTLMNLILGRLRASSGRISVDGMTMTEMSDSDIADVRSHWGIIPEDSVLLSDRTVLDNVQTSAKLSSSSRKVRRRDIDALLRSVRLLSKRKNRPSDLSNGQRKLLQLVMAVARNPLLLLWDDPSIALDGESFDISMDTLRKLHIGGTSILVTTSEPDKFSGLGWREQKILGAEGW